MSALAALGLVAGVCASLIAYEFLRHREERAWIRSRRGVFTQTESDQLAAIYRRNRRSREGR